MTNRKLAKIILDYIPYWEMPFTEDKDNYKAILKDIKENPQSMYDYLYNEDDYGEPLNTIIKELKRRIK
jgi:hypothetical protein